MDDLAYIVGLANENEEALGFIPETRMAYYIAREQYIIQPTSAGKRAGYILHGKPTSGGILTIAQAVIDYDLRDQGLGRLAVSELIDRARKANSREIKLRCADDLEANNFWQTLGFKLTNTLYPANRRRRAINVYMLSLWPRLF